MKDAHEVLGVPANAGAREIRAAYIARLRTIHPDLGGGGDDTESVSDIVRAYRTLRNSALGRKRLAQRAAIPIRMRPVRPTELSARALAAQRISATGPWSRAASILVLALAVGAVFYLSTNLPRSNRVLKAAERPALVEKTPDWLEIEAIDPGVLSEAVADARAFTADSSSARLERHSRHCFSRLEQAPSVKMLDYCLAFDSAATSLNGSDGLARATQHESFFHPGQMSVRHSRALGLLLPDKAAADARHSEVEARATSELIRALPI